MPESTKHVLMAITAGAVVAYGFMWAIPSLPGWGAFLIGVAGAVVGFAEAQKQTHEDKKRRAEERSFED